MHRKRLRFRCYTKMNKPEKGGRKLKYGRQPSYLWNMGIKKALMGDLHPSLICLFFCSTAKVVLLHDTSKHFSKKMQQICSTT